MIKRIQRWLEIGQGWVAQVNLKYDDKTLEVLHEEVVCSHKKVNYKNLIKELKMEKTKLVTFKEMEEGNTQADLDERFNT